jgi:tetratricopeptide (TPR) repeat protein
MKRPQLVSQGTLTRMLQSAEQAWQRKDFKENIEILERASRMDPVNVGILLQLGRMYGLRFDYSAAERCFEKAIRVAPRKLEVLGSIGMQCRDLRDLSLAERYFRQALEQKWVSAEACVNLAELYERLRRTEDASHLIDRALSLDPAYPPGLLARARLARQNGRLDEAEKTLRSFLATADRETRIRGYYELGGVLDRLGRYDEAMAAFLEAKALVRPDSPPFIKELLIVRERLRLMKSSVTGEMIQKWIDAGSFLQPTHRIALLCGHPRSGTTLLEQVLDSHPDIISAEETEVFHDEAYVPLTRGLSEAVPMLSVLESARISALMQSRKNYFSSVELLLGAPINGRVLIDKNPSLTFLVPALIRVFPEIKLLVALRDPRDVCLSCFMQPFYPIGQTTAAYLTLKGTVEEYAALMGIWRTLAPLVTGHYEEVRYEDMVNDLESVSRRAISFLGVSWDTRVLRFDEHARQKAVRSPTYADVAKPIFKTAVGRWRNYEKHLAPHLDILAPFTKAFGYE